MGIRYNTARDMVAQQDQATTFDKAVPEHTQWRQKTDTKMLQYCSAVTAFNEALLVAKVTSVSALPCSLFLESEDIADDGIHVDCRPLRHNMGIQLHQVVPHRLHQDPPSDDRDPRMPSGLCH